MLKTGNSNRRVFGVFGYGRFGRLWARELSRFGRVLIYEPKKITETLPRGVRRAGVKDVASADVVFFCVPISSLRSAALLARPHMKSHAIILDTCSVKVRPVKVLKEVFGKKHTIIGTHPLFGPDSALMNGGIRNLKVAVCPVNAHARDTKEIFTLFRAMGLKTIVTTPKAHDQSMAPSQALVHLIGRGLANFHLNPREVSTPDYASLVRIATIVGKDTWELFSDMQRENPYADAMRERFISNLEDVETHIVTARGDLKVLRDAITRTDARIIRLLARRIALAENIGRVKKVHGLAIHDQKRERVLSAIRKKSSRAFKVSSELVEDVFSRIVKHSKAVQKQRTS